MAQVYITSGYGFIKEIAYFFDENEKQQKLKIEYTDRLFDAKLFNSKTAKKIIEERLAFTPCFIYNPYKEYIINEEKVYEVREKTKWIQAVGNVLIGFVPLKMWKEKITDVDFLNKRKTSFSERYSYEDALRIAKMKNELILKEFKDL